MARTGPRGSLTCDPGDEEDSAKEAEEEEPGTVGET